MDAFTWFFVVAAWSAFLPGVYFSIKDQFDAKRSRKRKIQLEY